MRLLDVMMGSHSLNVFCPLSFRIVHLATSTLARFSMIGCVIETSSFVYVCTLGDIFWGSYHRMFCNSPVT